MSEGIINVPAYTAIAGSEKMPLLVTAKSDKPRCFKYLVPAMFKRITWITYALFMQFLTRLDRKMATKKRKILIFPVKHTQPLSPLWTAGWEKILQPGRQGFLNARRVTTQAVLLEKLAQQGHKLKM
jgi:hypothetical protein